MSLNAIRKETARYLASLVKLRLLTNSVSIVRESDYGFVLSVDGVRIRVNVQIEAELGNRKPKSVSAAK